MSPIPPTAVRDVYVIVRRGPEVLLMLREGTGYKDGCWGLPSGKVEPGETYVDAGVREPGEETGLAVEGSELRLALMLDRMPSDGGHWVGAFFELTSPYGEPRNVEPDKCRELRWCAISDLPTDLVDYVGHALTRVAERDQYAIWRDH